MTDVTPVSLHSNTRLESAPPQGIQLSTRLAGLNASLIGFDKNGRIFKTCRSSGIRSTSTNACGWIPLHKDSSPTPVWYINVHDGKLQTLCPAAQRVQKEGFRFEPSWQLDLTESGSVTDAALLQDADSMLGLIEMVQRNTTIPIEHKSLDLMVGLALADSNRLRGLSTQKAWAELSDLQQMVVIRWFSGS